MRIYSSMDATVHGNLQLTVKGGHLSHEESGTKLAIGSKPVVVGRAEHCDLRLPNDKQVSKVHCELVAGPRGVLIRDLKSANGTWINGMETGLAHLTREARLVLGNSHLEFVPDAEPLKQELRRRFGSLEFRSTVMQQMCELLEQLAAITVSVHVTGESGTGKTHIAREIHNQSPRAHKPFVSFNCSELAPTLAEGQLFGWERGAFTGAERRHVSPFIEADGGTLFLDEVAEIPYSLQARLLTAIDNQEIKPLGGRRFIPFNVRIISASNADLIASVNANPKTFRADLYYRLAATRIELPPLRDRKEDIEPLIQQILTRFGRPDAFNAITPENLQYLTTRKWSKGNVRPLKSALQAALELWKGTGPLDVGATARLQGGTDEIGRSSIVYKTLTARGTDQQAVQTEAMRVLYENLVRETNGNVSEIARRVGGGRTSVRRMLAELGLRGIETPSHSKTSDSEEEA